MSIPFKNYRSEIPLIAIRQKYYKTGQKVEASQKFPYTFLMDVASFIL